MKKGVTGFTLMIYSVVIFLIVVAVLVLIFIAIQGNAEGLFTAISNIFKGLPPGI